MTEEHENVVKAGLDVVTDLLGKVCNLKSEIVLKKNELKRMEKDFTSLAKTGQNIVKTFTQKGQLTLNILKTTIDKILDSESSEEEEKEEEEEEEMEEEEEEEEEDEEEEEEEIGRRGGQVGGGRGRGQKQEELEVKEDPVMSQIGTYCLSVPPELHNEFKLCCPEYYKRLKKTMEGEIYPIKEKNDRKRQALIICNTKFDHLRQRSSAKHDILGMTKVLKDLGYNVDVRENLTAKQMESELKAFAAREEHLQSDSTFLVFMSHGIWDGICGIRHEEKNPDVLATNTIFQTFNNNNCPNLRGKPKVIIIQACRGDGRGMIWVQDKKGYSPDHVWSFQVNREFNFACDSIRMEHVEKDFIAFCSTTPHNVSWTIDEVGSVFIKQLIECFQKYAHCWHLEDIFLKVRNAFETPDKIAQMPTVERLSLTRRFYLFPGI
ncbi:caspase-4 isoform X1 [Sarcophilus harrisii]|uniref:Caspase 12 (gene/pseudogene) n=1 Tax=Sarcophilus harrisii TaxID=9305 RepID=G3W0I1_SARHA|nr:caspase-4 isoform X1 [Sarcophilus harrisii]